ncbi:hypothetical protein NPIL_694151, partial [Nephila pilipes]
YDSETCRFVDPPLLHENYPLQDDPSDDKNKLIKCLGCIKESDDEKIKCVKLDFVEEEDDVKYYNSATWLGVTIRPGDCVYIDPEVFPSKVETEKKKQNIKEKEVDDSMYPEVYRRKNDYVKGSNVDVPEPFKIGYIIKIFQKKKKSSLPKITVKIFYRPEDTHKRDHLSTYELDLNLIYYSDDGVCTAVYIIFIYLFIHVLISHVFFETRWVKTEKNKTFLYS